MKPLITGDGVYVQVIGARVFLCSDTGFGIALTITDARDLADALLNASRWAQQRKEELK